ncbi:DUF6311 domain-containing protein [Phyllobacterium endophyticum]|uniref:Glycosyltransferase RgtA/B/C/D-like domain-containing protein n=1 Tax=Phyllobacterium endophyticum TaxID=1149773 RepID=A0A2P7AVZ9_9HYPH|nr:DUF6311 domain-containing protein [Phyllobacterium endophyticum]MBB3234980.1 hypothetical protein [Phyllobacterium endophyticum]PSH58392.1 hypothetical protein CU100_12360 [Phyllobacterium endophyticum]TYR39063.1 hypothetical protein FY050_24210 [Phyllobacterium endophyticum]
MYPVIAAILGLALAFLIFPHDLVVGISPYWDNVQGDNAANWIGYEAFARDTWHWPIFKTTLLSPPEGVNVLFTDPIPGLALLGKLTLKATGWLPNYFGPWLLFAYALQPAVAYYLLRRLSLTKVSAFLGALFFLFVPAFIFRYGHFSLLGHWILLASLLVYYFVAQGGSRAAIYGGAAFTFSIILINPYLLVMAIAIYCAALVDGAFSRRIPVLQAAAVCVALAMSIVGTAFLFGFVEIGRPTAGGGFGRYSMNLLSPIMPQLSTWPGHEKFILDATRGQYEGYNYLGGGILGLILIAALFAWQPAKDFIRRSPALFIFAGLMGIYALSTQIYLGDKLLASLALDQFEPFAKFAGMFRSSGRFFWPMGYLILTCAIYAIYMRFGANKFALIATSALAVQIGDVRPLISSVSERALKAPHNLDALQWSEIARAHNEILLLPQFLCMSRNNRKYAYDFGQLAARSGLPTNSAIINRSDVDCAAERLASFKDLKAAAVRDNPLIIAFKDAFSRNAMALGQSSLACRETSFAYVCSPNDSSIANIGPELGSLSTIRIGEEHSVAEGGEGLPFLAAGWSAPSQWGVWGLGPESVFLVAFEKEVCGNLAFRAKIKPFELAAYLVKEVQVTSDSGPSVSFSIEQPGEQVVTIPIPIVRCTNSLKLSLRFFDLKSPHDLGFNDDPRRISWGLQSFSFQHVY